MTKKQKIIKIFAICLAFFIIINIISWSIYGISLATEIPFKENQEEKITFEEVYQNIESIEIETISSDITITTGEEFKVESKNTDKNFSFRTKNNRLEIEEKPNWLKKIKTSVINIIVPINTTLEEINIDSGAGNFKIDKIQAKEFEIDHGAGLLEIKNSIFHETDINGGAGKINIIDSKLQNLELDAGVGKIEIQADITGNSKIECGVGELELTLFGTKEDYSINTKKGLGKINIDGQIQENNTTYGIGSRKIHLEGGIGNIKVLFKD